MSQVPVLGTEVNENWCSARARGGGTRNLPTLEQMADEGVGPLVASSAIPQQWG